tara:strand:- start:291 stop:476 length:186 start_codon:yes stop_codon:yes gene_type:complete
MQDIIIEYREDTVDLKFTVYKDPNGIAENNIYWVKSYSYDTFRKFAKDMRTTLNMFLKKDL